MVSPAYSLLDYLRVIELLEWKPLYYFQKLNKYE
jgi:hypothetical protein